jgi:hypothetical protein
MLADLAAVCMLLLSIYVHWRLPQAVDGEGRSKLTGVLLGGAGAALGLLAVMLAQVADIPDTSRLALFLVGFGQVHAPAAVVLLRRSQRAKGMR